MTRTCSVIVLLAISVASCDEAPPSRRCSAQDPCPEPQICNEAGRCVDPPADPKKDGEPCQTAVECVGQACVDLGQGPACASKCAQSAACGEGTLCRLLPGKASGADEQALHALCAALEDPGRGFLGEACADDSECTEGICHEGQCARLCGECPARTACEEVTVEREGLSAGHGLCRLEPYLRIEELGSVAATASGEGTPFSFTATEGEALIVLAEGDEDKVVAIRRLEGPDGTVLVDMDDPKASLTRSGLYHGTGALALPGTDDAAGAVRAGTYKVWPQTYEPRYDKLVRVDGQISRVAIVSRRFKDRGGLLDLNLHFTPGTGITAETAANDGTVQDSLAELDRLFRGFFGIAVGQIGLFDLPADHDAVSEGDQVRLVRSTYSQPGARGPAVNVFWIKSLGGAKGLAGGIPGAPGAIQRPSSGILLEKTGGGKTMGRLLAHEIGHYLGLWHTTETQANEIAAQDAITDTPVCPNNTAVEQCPDYQNVMFPYYLYAPDPLRFSAGQAHVVRGSPWLYQVSYAAACGEEIPAIDITDTGFASGNTAGAASTALAGSCGGDGAGEVVHLLRLPFAAQSLEIVAAGHGFDAVLYVRKDSCADDAAEVACAAAPGDGTPAQITLETPEAGDYFVIVDGSSGGGRYDLSAAVTK